MYPPVCTHLGPDVVWKKANYTLNTQYHTYVFDINDDRVYEALDMLM